ncbi:MAG: hypothetical protein AAGI11_05610 [Pseudomonadota bacterium]
MSTNAPTSSLSPTAFATWVILLLALPTVTIFYLNLSADPFQLVFKDDPDELAFLSRNGQDRYQNPGVVINYQPSSIVVGHSLAANFQPSRLEKTLGWQRVYNLSMQGSTIYEHRRVVDYALERAPVERVFWLFFPPNLGLPPKVNATDMVFPEYLYDWQRLNDLRFFATLPTNLAPFVAQKAEARRFLEERALVSGRVEQARDYATNWQLTRSNRFNAPNAVAEDVMGDLAKKPREFMELLRAGPEHLTPKDFASSMVSPTSSFHPNVESNLRGIVAANPQVQFLFVPMPPLSLLHWQTMRATDIESYLEQLSYVRSFVEIMSPYGNVEIYGFGLSPLAEDLRLYRDYGHYHMAVNEAMLDAMASGGARLHIDNIDQHLSSFDRRVLNYRLRSYQPVDIENSERLVKGELSLVDGREIVSAIERRSAARH